MIREASIYALKKLPADERSSYGLRVLTTRKWLQGVRKSDIDLWLPDAGPSLELLKEWQEQVISWHEFTVRYEEEQIACEFCSPVHYENGKRLEPVQRLPQSPVLYLTRKARTQDVTVLCWEQHEQCHRYSLVKLIEQEMNKDREAE